MYVSMKRMYDIHYLNYMVLAVIPSSLLLRLMTTEHLTSPVEAFTYTHVLHRFVVLISGCVCTACYYEILTTCQYILLHGDL